MPYITKKTPTARTTDTAIGKVMGYLSELLEYLKWENMALSIDTIFPDIWPLDQVQNLLIAMCRGLYDRIYQGAYDRGADKGNEINSQIMGWLNDVKAQAFAKVSEAQAYIQNNLINPIKNQIDGYITPKLNDALNKLSTVNTNISNAYKSLNDMATRINSFDSTLKNYGSSLESYRLKLNELVEVGNNLNAKLSQVETYMNDIDKRVKALEGAKAPFDLSKILQT